MARRKLEPEHQQAMNAMIRKGIDVQVERLFGLRLGSDPELIRGCEDTLATLRKQLKCNHDYEPAPPHEARDILRIPNSKKKLGTSVERCIHCCTIWIL